MWDTIASSFDIIGPDLASAVPDLDSHRSCIALCAAAFMVATAAAVWPTAARDRLDELRRSPRPSRSS